MSENEKKKIQEKHRTTLIGGQALLEGVMMRGKTAMAMAVRDGEGIIQLETERIKPRGKFAKFPIIRGVVAFISSLVMGVKTLTRSADVLTPKDEKPLSKGMVGFSVFLALLIAIGLFFALPTFLAGLFYDFVYKNALVKNLISGAIRILLFISYLYLVSFMKDINRTFMYHGAEHKTINCYEKGLELTTQNVQSCPKAHNRCGTTFVFFVMIISILTYAFLDLWLYDIIKYGGIGRNLTLVAAHILALPLVAGLSFELLQGLAKMGDNPFARVIRAPGLALQRLTTKEPDDGMVEVAVKSFEAVLEMDANPDIKPRQFNQIPMEEVRSTADKVIAYIGAEPVEAEWILCELLKVSRNALPQVKYITAADELRLNKMLTDRVKMPLDYVFGKSSFYGLEFKVDSRVLIPRMDTEILAEAAIAYINDFNKRAKAEDKKIVEPDKNMTPGVAEIFTHGHKKARVLDLCTGSGCIAGAIAENTTAIVTASDISEDALEVAKLNLLDKGVEIVQSDMFTAFKDRMFDIIVCNPPYITDAEMNDLQWEVSVQPHLALCGGDDGLEYYRRIALNAGSHMAAGAILMLEVGHLQADAVEKLLRSVGGFTSVKRIKDLQGIERVIIAS